MNKDVKETPNKLPTVPSMLEIFSLLSLAVNRLRIWFFVTCVCISELLFL